MGANALAAEMAAGQAFGASVELLLQFPLGLDRKLRDLHCTSVRVPGIHVSAAAKTWMAGTHAKTRFAL